MMTNSYYVYRRFTTSYAILGGPSISTACGGINISTLTTGDGIIDEFSAVYENGTYVDVDVTNLSAGSFDLIATDNATGDIL